MNQDLPSAQPLPTGPNPRFERSFWRSEAGLPGNFALNLRSKLQKWPKKKGPRNPENPCYDCDRGDRIRTCDLVLPKQTYWGLYDWDFRPQLAW